MSTLWKDLVVQKGDTFEYVVQIQGGPADLTGFTVEMHVRESRLDDSPLLLELSGGNGLTLDTALRRVLIEVDEMVTGALDWTFPAAYDLKMEGAGKRWRLMEGSVRLSETVTV